MQSPLSRESVHTTLAKPAKQLMAGCTPSSQVDGDATTSITAAPPHCICLSLCAKFHLLSFCWCLRVLLNRSAIWVNVSLQTNCQQRDGPHLTVGASWLHPWMHNIVRSKDPWWWKWHMRWETIMWPLQQHNATTSEWSWQQTDVRSELLSQQLVCCDLTTSFWSHLAPGICIGWNILCWLSHIVIVTKLLTQQAGCVSQRHLRWPPNHCHNDIFEVLHDKSHPVPARQQHGLSLHDLLVLFVKGCHDKRHLAF